MRAEPGNNGPGHTSMYTPFLEKTGERQLRRPLVCEDSKMGDNHEDAAMDVDDEPQMTASTLVQFTLQQNGISTAAGCNG